VITGLLLGRGDRGFTAYEAIYEHGITRAAAYIRDLRREGWKIGMDREPGETARYWLIEAPADGPQPVFRQEVLW
jgi:hypothetical protein